MKKIFVLIVIIVLYLLSFFGTICQSNIDSFNSDKLIDKSNFLSFDNLNYQKITHFNNAIVKMDKIDSNSMKNKKNAYFTILTEISPVVSGIHPVIASDSLSTAVLGYEDNNSSVSFIPSFNIGESWSNESISWEFLGTPKLPEIDGCGDNRFIGCVVNENQDYYGSLLYKIMISDPTLIPGGYSLACWSWYLLGYINFTSIAVGGYTSDDPDENLWAYGGHSIVGDNENTNRSQVPLYSYQFDEGGMAWICAFDDIYNGCNMTTHDIDLVTLESYAIWNYNNNGTMDIFFTKFDYGQWEPYPLFIRRHPNLGSGTITTTGNDDYIDVSSYNDNVIIVSQRDGDVIAYYSFNGLDNVQEVLIENEAFNPRIIHIYSDIFTCILLKNNILYYSITEDGGETWCDIIQVDDQTVNLSNECRVADICQVGTVWNNSEEIISFSSLLEPIDNEHPNYPSILGPTQCIAKINYDFSIKADDPEGNAVYYFIDWGDGNNSNWIGPYPSGDEVIVTHMWNQEGEYEITAKARDIFNNQSNFSDPLGITVIEDIQSPVTLIDMEGQIGEDDWFIDCITITLTAYDDLAGVLETYYRFNETWLSYEDIFEICEDGEYIVEYYSVDRVGNEEDINTCNLKIDKTNPTITLDVEQIGILKWLLTANVSDETSGIAKVKFYLDNNLIGEDSIEPFELEFIGTGNHTVYAIVYDNAGNYKQSAILDTIILKKQKLISPLINWFLERHTNIFTLLKLLINQ